jgi:YHS domain-containing protein
MEKDPVCGMMVEPNTAAASYEFEGTTYYFCAVGCKVAFEKDPSKYLGQGHSDHDHHAHH